MIIQHLLEQNESLNLEFKKIWYWGYTIQDRSGKHSTIKKTPKNLGEMLKDIVSLLNTRSEGEQKYIVIGFDEAKKETVDFTSSVDKKNEFTSTNSLQNFVISQINMFFKAGCSDGYIGCENIALDDYINFKIENHDDKGILLISIKETPFILESIKEVQTSGAHTLKPGIVPIRKTKTDGSPENTVATIEDIKNFQSTLKKISDIIDKRRVLSVKKLVQCFKNSQLPKAKISELHNSKSNYEHYILNAPVLKEERIHIIYFNKKTSQTKTAIEISTSGKINHRDQIFLITENKNKDGGQFNEKKIRKDFLDFNLKPEIFTIENFSSEKIYEDIFDEEIIHDGSFSIKDFVPPKPSDSKKSVEFIISEWLDSETTPLLVVKGSGGIGKTTVIKHYLDKIYKYRNQKIIFISSHDLINTLNENNEEISDIYDFYRAYLKQEESDSELDKKVFELTIDHGNLLFVIDGIDEVLAKLGSKFNINKLIISIFEEYIDTIGKTKIIFTCRDEFWNLDSYDEQIRSLRLLPFNLEQTIEYFDKKFSGNKLKAKKALEIAKKFSINKNSFLPYLLDMITENLITTDYSDLFPDTELIDPNIQNDFIIGKFCDREVGKLGHQNINSQIDFLICLSKLHYGKSNSETLKKQNNLTQNQIDIYKAHTLLSYEKNSDSITFKYDFFEQYFKGIYAFNKLKSINELDDLGREDKICITESLSSPTTIDYFSKRIKNSIELIKHLEDMLYLNKDKIEIDKELNSFLFYLIIISLEKQNKEERTSLLKSIFKSEDDTTLEFIPLINFYPYNNNKMTFDFRDLKIKDSFFENYSDFSDCNFGDSEIFFNSSFKKPLGEKSKKPNYTRENFNSNCDTLALINSFEKIEETEKLNKIKKEENLRKVLRFFHVGGTFKNKTETKLRSHMKMEPHFIDQLISKEILVTSKATTREKRMEISFSINEAYKDQLNKIMDQNSSNQTFTEILNLIP